MLPSGLSTIWKATSTKNGPFEERHPFVVPEETWEAYGCEDPRVTFFEGQYITFYTALGGFPFGPGNIKVAVALSPDLEHITERHLVTPFNAKAMVLFPERIQGKITVLVTVHTDEPPSHIAIAQCDRLEELWDLSFWEAWHAALDTHIINPLRSDKDHVEVGAAPIKTESGWLFLYSYIQNYFGGKPVFGIEALLLDLENPLSIIGTTKNPILTPEALYERFGIAPNIVFPSGALLEGDRLDIYYGGADSVCAKASLHLPDLLQAMSAHQPLAIRALENPILSPLPEHAWESRAVFNPAAIDIEGKVRILYRAMSQDNTSVFGYAESEDGVHISYRSDTPAYVPRAEFEQKKGDPQGNSGCEDPRLTRIDDTIYLFYTAYDGARPPRVAMSHISVADFAAKNWHAWTEPALVTPDAFDDKDMWLLPEKVAGQYMVAHRISPNMCVDFIDSLDFSQSRITRCIELITPRAGYWDSEKIGAAGTPIKTDAGWLVIYHGVSSTKVYRLGAILLDLADPSQVLARTIDPIFEPETDYEKVGQIPNVVFSCGTAVRGDTLFLYYGGADSVIGVATLSLERMLSLLSPISLS